MSNTRFWVLGCVLLGVLACHDEPTAPVVSGTNGASQALTRVSLKFLQVSTGYSKGCGVTTDHRAYCWRVGKVNPGDYPFVAYPVPGALSFQQVSVSKHDDEHFCGIATDSLAYCWGENESGQLGNGTFVSSATPVAVAGGRRFLSITAGAGFTCARNLNNHPYCWGITPTARSGTGTRGIQ